MSDADDTLRARNMRKRRERLLSEARHLLANGGFEALNLRDLARRADVTVPTIYNLLGRKEDVLLAVAEGVLQEIESRTAPVPDADPLTLASAVVIESTRLFEEDPAFYRGAFLAVEWLDQGGQHHADAERIFAWVGRLVGQGIDACRVAKLLQGRIPSALMAEQFMRAFRMSCRGWAFGHYDIEAFRSIALADLYITLSADAVETFRLQLARRIAERLPAADDSPAAPPTQTRQHR